MRILKALCTAQAASVIDFVVTVLLSSVMGVYYVVATSVGAVTGGVANCIFNYHWVFPGSGVSKWHIAIKYFLVWVVSILLNVEGTYLLTEWLRDSQLVTSLLGAHANQVYIFSKIVVALVVALAWNYQMQRLFVYRNLKIR